MAQHQAIETGIDRLMALIHNHQEISLTHAAKMLNISKPMLEHWAEALEESGQIVTRQTLGDMILTTTQMNSCRTLKQRIFEQILSMRTPIQAHDMRTIKVEQKKLREQIKEMDLKSKELKKISKEISEIKSREAELKVREAKIIIQEREIAKEQQRLEKKEVEIANRENIIKITVDTCSQQRRAHAKRERDLHMREREIASREHSFEKSIAQIQSLSGN